MFAFLLLAMNTKEIDDQSSTFHRHIKTVPQSSEVARTVVLGDRIGIPALNSEE